MSHDNIPLPQPAPLPESIAGMCELAFHYSTNRPNFEGSWRVLWTMLLSTFPEHLELAKNPHYQLFPTSEYPLSKRNAFQSPTSPFDGAGLGEDPESETDGEPSEDEDDIEPSKVEGDEASAQPKTPSKITSFTNPFLNSAQSEPYPRTSESAEEAVEDLPPPPQTPPRKEYRWSRNTPSVASTRAIVQGRDAKFYVDFAVLSISRNPNSEASVKIFNRIICPPTVNIPIALELKKSTKRSRVGKSFVKGLSDQILFGRTDIEEKIPEAFTLHRTQASIVGISASAMWWSFTIIYPGGLRPVWSKAFVCGHQPHDDILETLFQAAALCPSDPAGASNQDGPLNIGNILDRNARVVDNESDLLAEW